MAVGLAAELKESFKIDAELLEGSKGIFDVHINDKLIFSKHAESRFPFLGEVTSILKKEEICDG